MIELLWKGVDTIDDVMELVTLLLAWINQVISTRNEKRKRKNRISEVIAFHVKRERYNGKLSSLLVCDEKDYSVVRSILQQPPGEFKGKYEAHIIPNEEYLDLCISDMEVIENPADKLKKDDDETDSQKEEVT